MINRINYELKLRKLKYSVNNNVYSRIYRRIALKSLKHFYYFKNNRKIRKIDL